MKLEPNMYVRTKCGVEQIYRIDNDKTKYKYLYKLKKQDGDGCIDCGALSSEDILKASYNIIDLIEIGDYVNGIRVGYINKGEDYFYALIDENTIEIICGYDSDGFTKPLDSILTKEQFESMAYKVDSK